MSRRRYQSVYTAADQTIPNASACLLFRHLCCTLLREGKYTSRAAISKQVRIAGVMLAQLHTVTESFCFRVEREQKQAQRSRLHSCLHNSPFTMATGESSQLFTCSISLPQTLPTVFAVRALQCYVKRATLELNRVQPMWMRCFRKCCSE